MIQIKTSLDWQKVGVYFPTHYPNRITLELVETLGVIYRTDIKALSNAEVVARTRPGKKDFRVAALVNKINEKLYDIESELFCAVLYA